MKLFYAVPYSGCAWWRCIQPANMIEKLGLAEVRILNGTSQTQKEVEDCLEWCDVVVQQSAMGINNVAAIAKFQKMGKAVVVDYDDLSFLLSPFNPAYKTLGLSEVKVNKDGKETYLWKNGENGFAIEPNYFRYKSLKDILRLSNGITTTGKYIRDTYLEYNKNIYIIPNSIDFSLFKPFPKKHGSQVRIGWAASDSHHVEVWMVKRIMRKVFDKYKDKVRFVMLGNIAGINEEFKNDSFERHNFIGLGTYPMKLAALDLDISICPLEPSDFNKGKSPLKWNEMAALGVPCVCSKLEPYEVVEDSITGMVAKDEDEFFTKLCALIESQELRDTVSINAYDKTYDEYNLEKNTILWMDAFEHTLDRSQELPILGSKNLVESEMLGI